MKKNYAAWSIDPTAFSPSLTDRDKLLLLARYGILAPSMHNIQPWQIGITDCAIEVTFNQRRLLTGSDPTLRESTISLGCCVQNIVAAAQAYGLNPAVVSNVDDASSTKIIIRFNDLSAMRITNAAQLKTIVERVSNRSLYHQRSLKPTKTSIYCYG